MSTITTSKGEKDFSPSSLSKTAGDAEKQQRLGKQNDSESEKSHDVEDGGVTETVKTKVLAVIGDGGDGASAIDLKGMSWQRTTALLFGEVSSSSNCVWAFCLACKGEETID